MALVVVSQVVRSDIFNAPFVDVAGSDMPSGDQVAQPLRGVGIDLVVVRGHGSVAAHAIDEGAVVFEHWKRKRDLLRVERGLA